MQKKAQREKQHSVLRYLVSVPVVGGRVDSLPLVSLQQLLRVPDTHRASDDLSDVWHQHVNLQHRHTDRTFVRLVIRGLPPAQLQCDTQNVSLGGVSL